MKILFSLLCFLLACTGGQSVEKIESMPVAAEPNPDFDTYPQTLLKTDSIKNDCKVRNVREAGFIFSDFVVQQLIPYWIGTTWDYNGVTQEPGRGSIACGYFVTTVLRDAGVHINRVKQAQCASELMINSLTRVKENYSRLSFADFIQKVKAKGKGLSIIGLDNHTGFLYFDGEQLYFIHSSYVGDGKVAKEIASENSILQNSNYKVVGYISRDAQFLKSWMQR